MLSRKQRIDITVTNETLLALEERVPTYQRSEYIETALRKELGLGPLEGSQKGFAVYERQVDGAQGVQVVYAHDGKIVYQNIGAAPGLYHAYTGDGNPEWVGRDVRILRGEGFKRVRGSRVRDSELAWLQSEVND